MLASHCATLRILVVGLSLSLAALRVGSVSNCRQSEFQCKRTPLCIRLDQVCDGRDNCGDRSDEEPGCSHCNQTFVGDVGKTYRLTIPRPRADKLPFVCHLTFVANHHGMGDVVQLILEDFKLGRFQSSHHRGCPDGHLQLQDGTRKVRSGGGQLVGQGGQFCGIVTPDQPRPVFISESDALTATLRFFQFYGEQLENNFSFRLRYKFLTKDRGLSRYAPEAFRGDLASPRGCSRQFQDCSNQPCRIQSPNYPGLYPRNTTCFYRVHVGRHEVPAGSHPLIVVRQPDSSRVAILARKVTKYGQTDLSLGVDSDCDAIGDKVTVYDGTSPADPELISFCRGSAIPDIVSSGPDLLVAFESSPFATPQSGGPQSASGLELEVEIRFVKQTSMLFSQRPKLDREKCQFDITPSTHQHGMGLITNVAHALPSNSTCSFHFKGRAEQVVWLTFLKFQVIYHKKDVFRTDFCLNRLALRDPLSPNRKRLGEFCETNPPKMCDHSYLQQQQQQSLLLGKNRACTAQNETYVSSGPRLSLVEDVGETTAVTSLDFVLRYEFVDTAQDGQPGPGPGAGPGPHCHRVFNSASYSSRNDSSFFSFASPRNVFLFGRGGREDLHCSYTFHAERAQRVGLEITHLSPAQTTRPNCVSRPHPYLQGHSICHHSAAAGERTMTELWISELPDGATPIRKHCLCQAPATFLSNSSSLRVDFVVRNMTPDQDWRDLSFQGRFAFLPETKCQTRKVARGPGGKISLQYPTYCPDQPWVIETSGPDQFLFIKLLGEVLMSGSNRLRDGHGGPDLMLSRNGTSSCSTSNRITIYSGDNLTVICPHDSPSHWNYVELFSDGWERTKFSVVKPDPLQSPLPSTVIVDFIGVESTQSYSGYILHWLELSPPPELVAFGKAWHKPQETAALSAASASSCAYACPELSGCIGAELWCDGTAHCPSGYDENEANCTHLFAPILYIYGGVAIGFLILTLVVIVVVQRMRKVYSTPSCSSSSAAIVISRSNGLGTFGGSHDESITDLVRPPDQFASSAPSSFGITPHPVGANGGGHFCPPEMTVDDYS